MLAAPDHAVVGANDLKIAVEFFKNFGLEVFHLEELSSDASEILYGLIGARTQIIMRTPGAIPGIRIVETSLAPPKYGPLDIRGYTIDIYARDMATAIEYAKSKEYFPLPIAEWELDGKSVQECRILGPEGLSVVLVGGTILRDSLLDRNSSLAFSEINAFVNLVQDTRLDSDFWNKRAGLTQLRDTPFDGTPMVGLMELPEPGLEMRFALYWRGPDSTNRAKVELVSSQLSPERSLKQFTPLAAEFGPVVFKVDLPNAMEFAQQMLLGLEQTPFVSARLEGKLRNAVRAISPAGVAFELWCLEDSKL